MSDMENQGESYAQIRRDIDELRATELTFDNYKRHTDKVVDKDTIIISQIESLKREFVGENEKLKLQMESDGFKRTLDDGYVHREIFDTQQKLIRILTDSFSWKVIQTEMFNILFRKLIELMNDANALTVKRDAYKLMNDMEEKRNKVILENSTNLIEFSKEMMMEKLMMMDEKMNSRYESVLEQQRLERNELFDMFAKLTESLASKTDVNIEVTKKFLFL